MRFPDLLVLILPVIVTARKERYTGVRSHIQPNANHLKDGAPRSTYRKGPRLRALKTDADASDADSSTPRPIQIDRDPNSVCWAGNYPEPSLRQAEGSTEALIDPPIAVPDPYGWMRDDTRENQRVLDHLNRENDYTEKVNAHLKGLRQELYDEMLSRIRETDFSAPKLLNSGSSWVYYSRSFEGSGYAVYCRAPLPDDQYLVNGEVPADLIDWDGTADDFILPGEEVYLDGNKLAEGQGYSDIGSISFSPSERYVAYTWDNLGDEEYVIIVMDMETGGIVREYGEEIGLVTSQVFWGSDESKLYYLKQDNEWRPFQLYERRVDLAVSQEEETVAGAEQGLDKLLFEEPNQLFWVYAWKSNDDKYLFVGGFATETSEVRYINLQKDVPADNNLSELPLVAEKRQGVYYDVEHQEGHWLIFTDADDASPPNKLPNFRLVVSPAVPKSTALWTNLLDADGEPLFDGAAGDKAFSWFNPFKNHLVLEGREGGLPRIWVLDVEYDINNSPPEIARESPVATAEDFAPELASSAITLTVSKSTLLTFEEDVYDASVSGNRIYTTDRVRVSYSSKKTPRQTMSFLMNDISSSPTIIKKQHVPGYDKDLYETGRTFVTSRDGKTQIPISMVYRKDLVGSIMYDDEANDVPTLLYGYGSYGSSLDDYFSALLLPLLDRGVVFVQASVRGGGEMGREWYEEAKYLNKKRTFDDFVDVARWLVGQDGEGKGKITSPDKLAIRGGSAGGLLVGAAMNQAPELFRVAIMQVPFVDVICTMADASIPLTVGEWQEWGNPNEEKYFDYMLSYSPMNNIQSGVQYPSCFVTGGLHDSRVQYWEPAKFVAELRHQTGQQTLDAAAMQERPICLKTDMESGHSSSSDRYKSYRERARWQAFLLDQLGLAPKEQMTMDEGGTSSSAYNNFSGPVGALFFVLPAVMLATVGLVV